MPEFGTAGQIIEEYWNEEVIKIYKMKRDVLISQSNENQEKNGIAEPLLLDSSEGLIHWSLK